MALADALVTWVHLVGASIWVGGSIFLGMVLVPVLKSHTETLEEMVVLMVRIGRRFNKITIPAFAAFTSWHSTTQGHFWGSPAPSLTQLMALSYSPRSSS